jgi:hypothetical protein
MITVHKDGQVSGNHIHGRTSVAGGLYQLAQRVRTETSVLESARLGGVNSEGVAEQVKQVQSVLIDMLYLTNMVD